MKYAENLGILINTLRNFNSIRFVRISQNGKNYIDEINDLFLNEILGLVKMGLGSDSLDSDLDLDEKQKKEIEDLKRKRKDDMFDIHTWR